MSAGGQGSTVAGDDTYEQQARQLYNDAKASKDAKPDMNVRDFLCRAILKGIKELEENEAISLSVQTLAAYFTRGTDQSKASFVRQAVVIFQEIFEKARKLNNPLSMLTLASKRIYGSKCFTSEYLLGILHDREVSREGLDAERWYTPQHDTMQNTWLPATPGRVIVVDGESGGGKRY